MQEFQTSRQVLLVRPAAFGFNPQTAASNVFQHDEGEASTRGTQPAAVLELEGLVSLLRSHGVGVTVCDDTPHPPKPDAVFPNNWFSTHADGTLVLYPMLAENRRLERRPELIETIRARCGLTRVVDLTEFEHRGEYLEGTGSLVLDRRRRLAFAALSERTHPAPLEAFAGALEYRVVAFHTRHPSGVPLYHTNVLMAIGEHSAVVCLEAIVEPSARREVAHALEASGREVVDITFAQLDGFAGNLLQVRSRDGARFWVCSSQACHALAPEQRERLEADARLIHTPLETIERVGGGSARCMMGSCMGRGWTDGPRPHARCHSPGHQGKTTYARSIEL